jgi:hypothetical protein
MCWPGSAGTLAAEDAAKAPSPVRAGTPYPLAVLLKPVALKLSARAAAAAALLALAVLAAPNGGAGSPAEAAGAYQLRLYRPGDFVAQTNLYQCVGASMQMMINMMADENDRTAATQRRLWQLARTFSPPRPPDLPPRRGASVRGWAAGLNVLDVGPYRVVGFPTIQEAMNTAGRAMRATGKPVGLLVWGGRHAWVMSGFRSTADPRTGRSYRVTHAQVLDPLYPRGTAVWGASPLPGAFLSVSALGQDFVQRRRGSSPALARKWVIVMPVTPAVGSIRSGGRWLVRAVPPGRPSDLARAAATD